MRVCAKVHLNGRVVVRLFIQCRGRCACGGSVERKENQHLSQTDLYVSTNATVI